MIKKTVNPQADCMVCVRNECCNKDLHHLINGATSISYVADQFDRGFYKPDLVQRLLEQTERINTALKQCKRKAE